MAFMLPILGAVTPALTTGIGILGTVASTVSQVRSANYQSALLLKQAARDAYAGQVNAQDVGMKNAQEKAQFVLRQASSGFSTNSPAFAQSRAALAALSRRDQMRASEDGQAKAAISTANAATAKRAGFDAMLSGIFGIGKDLISGANLVAEQNTFATNESARTYGTGVY